MTFDLNDPETMGMLLDQIGALLSAVQETREDSVVLNRQAYELGMHGLARIVYQLENKIFVTHTPD